jgi:hypothetical protein
MLHIGVDNGGLGGVRVDLHPVAEAEAEETTLAELHARGSASDLNAAYSVIQLRTINTVHRK